MSGLDFHPDRRTRRLAFVFIPVILASILWLASRDGLWARPHQQHETIYVTVRGHVTLQRPDSLPPSDPWVVPLAITFTLASEITDTTSLITESTTYAITDPSGYFTATAYLNQGVFYDIRVKNPHTLRNVKRDVQVFANISVDMGTLLEGDANNDNRIRISDFAILRSAYFTNEGDPGFDPRADFNEDNAIRISDFALLRSNYFATGDIEVTTVGAARGRASHPAGSVSLAIIPGWQQVDVGDIFTVTAVVDADTQPIIGADVRLTFNALLLQGLQVTPGTAFDLILINSLKDGELLFSAGTMGNPVSGRIELFSLTLRALRATPAAILHFAEADAVDELGRSVLGETRDGKVQIGAHFERVYLPLLLR